jgi:hypothetical protein
MLVMESVIQEKLPETEDALIELVVDPLVLQKTVVSFLTPKVIKQLLSEKDQLRVL